MGIENLSEIEITIGICDTIFVIISLIIGIKMLSKYIKLKRRFFLTAALAWILLSVTWWGGVLSFFLYIMFEKKLNYILILILNNATVAFALMLWIYTICLVIYPERKKIILSIFLIICISYEILLLILIFISPNMVATISGTYFIKPQLFVIVFKLFAVITLLITGIIFSKKSLKSKDPEIQWKARFLSLAFISFFISIFEVLYVGVFFESVSILTIIVIIVFRIFLISSVFEYYLGFFLPDKIAKWLIKEKEKI